MLELSVISGRNISMTLLELNLSAYSQSQKKTSMRLQHLTWKTDNIVTVQITSEYRVLSTSTQNQEGDALQIVVT